MATKSESGRKKAAPARKKRLAKKAVAPKVVRAVKRKAFKKTLSGSSRALLQKHQVSIGSVSEVRKTLGIGKDTIKAVDEALSR